MDTTFSQSRILPEVILSILGLLEADKDLDSWKLSRTVAGKFSLSIDHVPTTGGLTKRRLPGLVSLRQDSVTAPVRTPAKPKRKKQKSPAQRKRDRERKRKWRLKR